MKHRSPLLLQYMIVHGHLPFPRSSAIFMARILLSTMLLKGLFISSDNRVVLDMTSSRLLCWPCREREAVQLATAVLWAIEETLSACKYADLGAKRFGGMEYTATDVGWGQWFVGATDDGTGEGRSTLGQALSSRTTAVDVIGSCSSCMALDMFLQACHDDP